MSTRIHIESLPALGAEFVLSEENSHYLGSVLRQEPGARVIVFESTGAAATAEVLGRDAEGRMSLRLVALAAPSDRPADTSRIVLLQGMLKGDKMDLVIQKATELGVSAIVPLVTERTQVRETRKLDRWRKIALEATRQSRRSIPPQVQEPVSLSGFLKEGLRGVVFYEAEHSPITQEDLLSAEGAEFHVLIGPEGGFSPSEVALACNAGLMVRGLGPNILRAETAALAALAVVSYLARLASSPRPQAPPPPDIRNP